ncbi:MAG: HesA/MoeB/ThiF family protein [Hydrotalea sp.]|nr:HesA/MoeB/ThiF family protein [Hydrotalea sp.]
MLTDDDTERYARQVVIKNIGEAGQARLMQTTIAMVGVGGIANHLLPLLVGAGLKKIILVDDDVVEKTNLARQLMFRESDIGVKKIIAAKNYLLGINPKAEIITHDKKIMAMADSGLLATADVLLEGSDNLETKLLGDKIATSLARPIIIGAATAYDGQVGFFHGDAYRYSDIFEVGHFNDIGNCQTAGILNSTLAQVAGLMAQLFFDYVFDGMADHRFFLLDRGHTIALK